MKTFAALTIAALAVTASTAIELSKEHHTRFLREQASLIEELAQWKESAAGQYAKANNLYTESANNNGDHEDATVDTENLKRLFLTKVAISEAQAQNPDAVLSTNSPFTLMTEEEFAAYVSKSSAAGGLEAFVANATTEVDEPVSDGLGVRRELASSVDWTTTGCVSDVKDQGYCGSCWAFSSAGALESAYCLKNGELQLFSDQQITSCDTVSSGCDGGWPLWGLNYVKKAGYICTEDSYPFTSGEDGETGTCSTSGCTRTSIKISSVVSVSASESALVTAITKQPVSVAVAAGNTAFKQYTSGVLSACGTTALDHAILAVGYDSTSFYLKNQWGTTWGNNGFINLKRNGASSACSVVNSHNVYPTLA